jgi:hypothetical protein
MGGRRRDVDAVGRTDAIREEEKIGGQLKRENMRFQIVIPT